MVALIHWSPIHSITHWFSHSRTHIMHTDLSTIRHGKEEPILPSRRYLLVYQRDVGCFRLCSVWHELGCKELSSCCIFMLVLVLVLIHSLPACLKVAHLAAENRRLLLGCKHGVEVEVE